MQPARLKGHCPLVKNLMTRSAKARNPRQPRDIYFAFCKDLTDNVEMASRRRLERPVCEKTVPSIMDEDRCRSLLARNNDNRKGGREREKKKK